MHVCEDLVLIWWTRVLAAVHNQSTCEMSRHCEIRSTVSETWSTGLLAEPAGGYSSVWWQTELSPQFQHILSSREESLTSSISLYGPCQALFGGLGCAASDSNPQHIQTVKEAPAYIAQVFASGWSHAAAVLSNQVTNRCHKLLPSSCA